MYFVYSLFVCICLSSSAFSSEDLPKKTICLNMIVKNEEHVIERCLESVLPLIDYWVIVDTGSDDNTIEVIESFMEKKGVPGEVHQRPWKNFEHNRNEALQLAKDKADYLLMMDADDYLIYDPEFSLGDLDYPAYYIKNVEGGCHYDIMRIVSTKQELKWVGVLHEYLTCIPYISPIKLEHIKNIYTQEGARTKDPLKFVKDAEILEDALIDEPDNARYVFYLAQSYRGARQLEKAIENYIKRSEMGGWDQEVSVSLYEVARLKEQLNYPEEDIVQAYLTAFSFRPTRSEALYSLMRFYRLKGEFEKGYQIGKIACSIPACKDILFTQNAVYEWGNLFEFSVCAYWTGRYEEAKESALDLSTRDAPKEVLKQNELNLGFIDAKMLEKTLQDIVSLK